MRSLIEDLSEVDDVNSLYDKRFRVYLSENNEFKAIEEKRRVFIYMEKDKLGKIIFNRFRGPNPENRDSRLGISIDRYSEFLDNRERIETREGLILYVSNGTLTKTWANGKAGQFKEFDRNYLYRFCETDEDVNSKIRNQIIC